MGAVGGRVGLAAPEPVRERRFPLECPGPLLEPEQLACRQVAPKRFRVIGGPAVELSISVQSGDVGPFYKIRIRWICIAIGHHGLWYHLTQMAARGVYW